jgi:arylsulfatase A-like enzyme
MIQPQSTLRAVLIALVASTAMTGSSALASESKKKNHEVARQALLRKEVLPLTQIQAIAARRMQVNAGMIEAADYHIGRLVDHLEASGQLDNTIIIVTSDNGPESGVTSLENPVYNHCRQEILSFLYEKQRKVERLPTPRAARGSAPRVERSASPVSLNA